MRWSGLLFRHLQFSTFYRLNKSLIFRKKTGVRVNNFENFKRMKLFAKFTLIIIVAMSFASCNKEEKRFNFLFVLVDDQPPFDLKVYDTKSILESPNIQKLTEDRMVFENTHLPAKRNWLTEL